jgi:hypothetical protein
MKTRFIGTSTWLFFLGAATVLLVGAFGRFDSSNPSASAREVAYAPMVLEPGEAPEPSTAPALPPNLSPGLDEIVRLARAHVEEGVLLAFVRNSGRVYNPTSDEIIYLTDSGVSQQVIAALFPSRPVEPPVLDAPPPEALVKEASLKEVAQTSESLPAPVPGARNVSFTTTVSTDGPQGDSLISPPPPPEEPPPALDPTTSFFYNDLAAYGGWINMGSQGWFWQPTVVTTTIGWQPYRDRGHWLHTGEGWYWQSDYSWGWAAFHYGRWLNNPRYGWLWSPGRVWGPSWVGWVRSGEFAGWAPLPPGVRLPVEVAGAMKWKSVFNPSTFIFARMADLTRPRLAQYFAPSSKAVALYKSARFIKSFYEGENAQGAGEDYFSQRVGAWGDPLKDYSLRDVSSAKESGERSNHSTLLVYRPKVPGTGVSAENVRDQTRVAEDESIPAREIPSEEDRFGRPSDQQPVVFQPGTPPPPPWSMRRFSQAADQGRPQQRAEEDILTVGSLRRMQNQLSHDVIVSGGVSPLAPNRNSQWDAGQRGRYDEARAEQRNSGAVERVAEREPERHSTASPSPVSSTSSNSKK